MSLVRTLHTYHEHDEYYSTLHVHSTYNSLEVVFKAMVKKGKNTSVWSISYYFRLNRYLSYIII